MAHRGEPRNAHSAAGEKIGTSPSPSGHRRDDSRQRPCRHAPSGGVCSYRDRIGRSRLTAASDSDRNSQAGSWPSTDINQRICREGIPRIRHSVGSAGHCTGGSRRDSHRSSVVLAAASLRKPIPHQTFEHRSSYLASSSGAIPPRGYVVIEDVVTALTRPRQQHRLFQGELSSATHSLP